MDDRRREQANSFGPAADLYDRARPGYPVEAVGWALAAVQPQPTRVADIGAGTGIMSRLLLTLGYDVLAVEPDDLMRHRLARSDPARHRARGRRRDDPAARRRRGRGRRRPVLPLVRPGAAHAEIARVVRPGGVFAAIWNLRDETEPWVAEFTTIVNATPGKSMDDHEATHFGPAFGPPERGLFRHTVTHTADTPGGPAPQPVVLHDRRSGPPTGPGGTGARPRHAPPDLPGARLPAVVRDPGLPRGQALGTGALRS